MVPVFQEVASGHKEHVLVPRVGGLVDALKTLLSDSEDVVGLLSLDERKFVHLSCKLWLISNLSVVELLLLLHKERNPRLLGSPNIFLKH